MQRCALVVLSLVVLLLAAVPVPTQPLALAQNMPPGHAETGQDDRRVTLAADLNQRTSPVPPRPASDSNFVTDAGEYLDQYLFREDVPNGRLPFAINIDRYYSPLITSESVDSNGFLLEDVRQDLVERLLLPEQAVLTLQIFDVDHESSYCPEVDHVYVNGQQLRASSGGAPAVLTSGNDTWSTWSIPVPIAMLKFPTAAGAGTERPQAVEQLIEIDINVLECPRIDEPGSAWAVGVDWGALSIPSPIRPIIFAHGWTGDISTFNDFERFALRDGIPSAGQPALARGILPIASTSPLLASAIDAATTRFGVDRVNIFAHSKGGLVARHALRSDTVASQVDHLVTFGSPHHGVTGWQMDIAIWANCSTANFPDPTQLQNCRDSGEALKIDNLRSFNYTGCRLESRWWGLRRVWVGCEPVYVQQPDVEYRTLVGGLLDIGARNATYPWNADARPFPNTANVDRTFAANHSQIKEIEEAYRCGVGYIDSRIYDDCRDDAARSARTAAAPATSDGDEQLVAYQEVTLQAGIDASLVAPIDGGEYAFFSATGVQELSLTLRAPDGTTITPESATARADISFVVENAGPMTEGWTYQFQVDNPVAGEWTLIAQAPTSGPATLTAMVMSQTALSLRSDQEWYRPGDTVTLEAVLSTGSDAMPGATMQGQLVDPAAATTALSFVDDGTSGDVVANDGIFATQFSAPASEGYFGVELVATANGTRRLQSIGFAVVQQSADIATVSAAETRDTNGNGLYNWLDLRVDIAVARAGHFELVGTLTDAAGNPIASAATSTRQEAGAPLAVGPRNLTLSFDGETLRRSGIDGPYTLTNLILYDQSGSGLVVDTANDLYATSAYQVTSFERPAILIASSSEELIDADGNGLYDELVVRTQFDLVLDGTYSWNGRLMDSNGREVGWYVGQGVLNNNAPAEFRFEGQRIGLNQYQGPYTLQDVSLYKTSGTPANGSFTEVYTTRVNDYRLFEGALGRLYLPFVQRPR